MAGFVRRKAGFVQGRLLKPPQGELQWFPGDQWQTEFFLARSLGLSYIELFAEREFNPKNPLWEDDGLDRIRAEADSTGLSTPVICDDYVINHSLLDGRAVRGNLTTADQCIVLMRRAAKLGASLFVLPLFEKSELTLGNFDQYRDVLIQLGRCAEESSLVLCLETLLEGRDLVVVLERLGLNSIKCVLDTGNRVALGQNLYEDILILGNTVRHVHIKDKNERGENVLLGTGRVNFLDVFEAFEMIGYQGLLTFETTRGFDAMRTAKYHLDTIRFFEQEAADR